MIKLHYGTTADSNLAYLMQYPGEISDPFLYLEISGLKKVFLSSTDLETFKDNSTAKVEAVDVGPWCLLQASRQGDAVTNAISAILKDHKISDKILVPENFSLGLADRLRAEDFYIQVEKDWCPQRVIKSPNEIHLLRNNFTAVRDAYELLEKVLRESKIVSDQIVFESEPLTSDFLKKMISKFFLDFDLTNVSGVIISCASQSAMPHHSGAGLIRPHETIIIDLFPRHNKTHYYADMTRTYVKGQPSDVVKRMYQAVAESKAQSLMMLRPGVPTKDVYEHSADVIRDHGFDVGEIGYTHSLGHGLGIDIHEAPNLNHRSDTKLEVGHVITIEPGLYYKKYGGVRLEDTVVITNDGYENLSNYDNEWIIE
jgi:Xaa-Pro aminopeptidase